MYCRRAKRDDAKFGGFPGLKIETWGTQVHGIGRLLASGFDRFGEGGDHFEEIADYAVVGYFEDGCF